MTDHQKPDEPTELVLAAPQRITRSWNLLPNTFGEAMEIATMIARSEFAPKDYKGKPESVLIAIQMGADVGLRPMQALQNIAVINGRPSIWGDGALALTMSLFEKFEETTRGEWPKDDFTAICTVRRRGWPSDTVREFSVGDAKHAGLWGKQGPWTNYPKRMLQMRVRSWALRDAAADRLMGMILAEEAMDIPEEPIHIGSGSTVSSEAPELVALQHLPEPLQDNIEKAFWTVHLTPGMRTAKLKEYLLGDPGGEDGAVKLLEWCRDEFAKQKTGKPVQRKGDGNGKHVSQPAQSTPAPDASAPEKRVDAPAASAVAVPAGAAAGVGAQPRAESAAVASSMKAPTLDLF